MVELSRQQEQALDAVLAWHAGSEAPIHRLFGYAGTGKTTLAREIAERLDGNVLFAAFTGKAAQVLQHKGCPTASTIHSLIYEPKDRSRQELNRLEQMLEELRVQPDAPPDKVAELEKQVQAEHQKLKQPAFALNEDSELRFADLLIVDEVSMVDEKIATDLLSFGTKILALGDPFQLPPVFGAGYFTNAEPDTLLTEIHRQALDSPILRLAHVVRNGGFLEYGDYGNPGLCRVLRTKSVPPSEFIHYDQIIVGRNSTRRLANQAHRVVLGFSGDLPVKDDKIVCLHNDHEVGLLNGGLWTVEDVAPLDSDRIGLSIFDEKQRLVVESHTHHFQGREKELQWWERREAQEFDFGYALTCHKAQGSQWDKVLVFDESSAFREHSRRWLYTAITRASERLTVVR